MIDRDDSQMQIVCDSLGTRCPKTYDNEDFDQMIADIKEDGWLVILERGAWRHYSPDSRSAENEFAGLPEID